jgi:uncharacterized protein (DUF427 family)
MANTNFKADHYFDLSEPDNRVVIKHNATVLADTTGAKLLKERAKRMGILDPTFYLPREDVNMEYLEPVPDYSTHCPIKGDTTYFDVIVDGDKLEKTAWSYDKPLVDSEPIRDYIAFDSAKVTVETHPTE